MMDGPACRVGWTPNEVGLYRIISLINSSQTTLSKLLTNTWTAAGTRQQTVKTRLKRHDA